MWQSVHFLSEQSKYKCYNCNYARNSGKLINTHHPQQIICFHISLGLGPRKVCSEDTSEKELCCGLPGPTTQLFFDSAVCWWVFIRDGHRCSARALSGSHIILPLRKEVRHPWGLSCYFQQSDTLLYLENCEVPGGSKPTASEGSSLLPYIWPQWAVLSGGPSVRKYIR